MKNLTKTLTLLSFVALIGGCAKDNVVPDSTKTSREKQINDGPVTITGLSTTNGIPYSSVIITGSNFSTVATDNVVKFNGAAAKVNSASATQLIVTIPTSATSGYITVATAGVTATSADAFHVLQFVKDGDFPPSSVEIDALAFDKNGGYYVTDNQASVIYKYAGGVLSRVAAVSGNSLTNAAVDSHGNIFFGRNDGSISCVYKVSPAGDVAIFAGGTAGYAEGNGTSAKFSHIVAVAVDNSDNLYVADQANDRIRLVTSSADVSTFAGGVHSAANGPVGTGGFTNITAMVIDNAGNLYIGDSNTIRKTDHSGGLSTLGVTGTNGSIGTGGTIGTLAVDLAGNVFFSQDHGQFDGIYTISIMNAAGYVTVTPIDFLYPKIFIDYQGRIYSASRHPYGYHGFARYSFK